MNHRVHLMYKCILKLAKTKNTRLTVWSVHTCMHAHLEDHTPEQKDSRTRGSCMDFLREGERWQECCSGFAWQMGDELSLSWAELLSLHSNTHYTCMCVHVLAPLTYGSETPRPCTVGLHCATPPNPRRRRLAVFPSISMGKRWLKQEPLGGTCTCSSRKGIVLTPHKLQEPETLPTHRSAGRNQSMVSLCS